LNDIKPFIDHHLPRNEGINDNNGIRIVSPPPPPSIPSYQQAPDLDYDEDGNFPRFISQISPTVSDGPIAQSLLDPNFDSEAFEEALSSEKSLRSEPSHQLEEVEAELKNQGFQRPREVFGYNQEVEEIEEEEGAWNAERVDEQLESTSL